MDNLTYQNFSDFSSFTLWYLWEIMQLKKSNQFTSIIASILKIDEASNSLPSFDIEKAIQEYTYKTVKENHEKMIGYEWYRSENEEGTRQKVEELLEKFFNVDDVKESSNLEFANISSIYDASVSKDRYWDLLDKKYYLNRNPERCVYLDAAMANGLYYILQHFSKNILNDEKDIATVYVRFYVLIVNYHHDRVFSGKKVVFSEFVSNLISKFLEVLVKSIFATKTNLQVHDIVTTALFQISSQFNTYDIDNFLHFDFNYCDSNEIQIRNDTAKYLSIIKSNIEGKLQLLLEKRIKEEFLKSNWKIPSRPQYREYFTGIINTKLIVEKEHIDKILKSLEGFVDEGGLSDLKGYLMSGERGDITFYGPDLQLLNKIEFKGDAAILIDFFHQLQELRIIKNNNVDIGRFLQYHFIAKGKELSEKNTQKYLAGYIGNGKGKGCNANRPKKTIDTSEYK